MLYGSVGRVGLRALLGSVAYTPLSLFAAGEQGVWLDNSDFTTLFQDAAGTTPVTGYEQFVGLRLDKSKDGVGTNGVKRVNFLTYTEQFDNAAWNKNGVSVPTTNITAPNGTNTADLIQESSAGGEHFVNHQTAKPASSVQYTLTCSVKRATSGTRNVGLAITDGATGGYAAIFDPDDGSVVVGSQAVGVTTGWSIATTGPGVDQGNGWWRFTITVTTNTATRVDGVVYLVNGTTREYNGDNTSNLYIWGADLRLASDAAVLPTYQRITDTWYNTIPGNHAYQTTTTARAVLSARYNQLTYTEQFDVAVWQKINVTGTYNTLDTTDPLGGNTADKFLETVTNGGHYVDVTSGIPVSINTAYTRSVCVKSAGRQWIALDMYDTTSRYTYFDIQNGVIGTIAPGTTASITSLGNGWFRCAITRVVSQTSVFLATLSAPSDNGNVLFIGDVTKGFYLWGADLRAANESSALPAYQRVGAAVNGTSTTIGTPDYDTVGFPAYLRYDGGDWYQTGSINFTATDKMSVFAGVRKLSDATSFAILAELADRGSSPDPGSFVVCAPGSGATYFFALEGSATTQFEASNFAAPVTNVLSCAMDISGASRDTEIFPRINGVVPTLTGGGSANAGTGNFGNYPLYFGARFFGPSLFFTGRDYGFVIVGRAVTATELANTEGYMETQTFGKDMSYVYSDELTTATGDLITAADGDQIYMTVQYV